MKLPISMVPKSCLMQNVRNQMQTAKWKRLCLKVFCYRSNYQCGICGRGHKSLHVEEIWQYNDLIRTRRLTGFLALCPLCYYGKNIEEARIEAARGDLNLKQVVAHFCFVNQCPPEAFHLSEAAARKLWKRRNRQKWKSDLGDYAYLVAPPPQQDEAPTKLRVRGKGKKPGMVNFAKKREKAMREKMELEERERTSSCSEKRAKTSKSEEARQQTAEWEQKASFEASLRTMLQN